MSALQNLSDGCIHPAQAQELAVSVERAIQSVSLLADDRWPQAHSKRSQHHQLDTGVAVSLQLTIFFFRPIWAPARSRNVDCKI